MTHVHTDGNDQGHSSSSPFPSARGADFSGRRIVASLMAGAPPICDGSTSIRQASKLMSDHRAVLVRTPSGYGIVTDSDLRRRVLSAGLSPDRPIAEVMTFPVHVVDREMLEDDVVLDMLEFGVHQLPVVEGEAVIGMVSDLDLLGAKRRSPFDLRSRIDSAGSSADFAEIGQSFSHAAADLWKAGVDAEHIGLWSGALTDRLTARLLEICVDHLGPAPVAWAWLALGSLGRREQALAADQDHALIYDNEGVGHDDYFAELAGEVVTGLAASGFPKCESRVMATEPCLENVGGRLAWPSGSMDGGTRPPLRVLNWDRVRLPKDRRNPQHRPRSRSHGQKGCK